MFRQCSSGDRPTGQFDAALSAAQRKRVLVMKRQRKCGTDVGQLSATASAAYVPGSDAIPNAFRSVVSGAFIAPSDVSEEDGSFWLLEDSSSLRSASNS
jgi:hypothetical protein